MQTRVERPIPRNKEETEKILLLDQVCADDTLTHCLPRVLRTRREDLPPCPYSKNGCHSGGWCEYRQELFENHSARYIAQAKLIEIEEWLLGVRNRQPETYRHALEEFSEGRYGNGAIFAYVWDKLGIRDLNELTNLCVYSVLDNPIVFSNPAPKQEPA